MQFKLLLFVLLGCMQIVAGSKQKQTKGRNRLLTFGMGLLYLNGAIAQKPTTNAVTCPTEVPTSYLDMMNYIRCGEREQTSDFFETYLTTAGEDDLKKQKRCKTISSLYQKAKTLGTCASGKLTSIVKGAQKRILGKTLTQEEELKMFEEHLESTDSIESDDVVPLSEDFEKNNKHQFFEIKEKAAVLENYVTLKHVDALKEVLKPGRQDFKFDVIPKMMPYAKKMHNTKLAQTEEVFKLEYQNTNFDKVDQIYKLLAEHVPMTGNAVKEVFKLERQNLNSDALQKKLGAVSEMMKYAKMIHSDPEHFLDSDSDVFDQVKEALKPEYQELNFKKVALMVPYARMIHGNLIHQTKVFRERVAREALKPEYQNRDFGLVEKAMTRVAKHKYKDPSEQAKEALKPEYQTGDFLKDDRACNHLVPKYGNAVIEMLKKEDENMNCNALRKRLDVFDRVRPYVRKMYNYKSDDESKLAIRKEALDRKYADFDFKKVERMMGFVEKFKETESEQIKEALDPKYQILDFDKVDHMIRYAQKIFTKNRNKNSFTEDTIKEALKPEYQKIDFDKADYIYTLLTEINNPHGTIFQYAASFITWTAKEIDIQNYKDALSEKYQSYDIARVQDVRDKLGALIPGKEVFVIKEALSQWVQKENMENISKALNICKNAKDLNLSKKKCWKLKTKKYVKKYDL